MGTEMTSFAAFHEEVTKIAQEDAAGYLLTDDQEEPPKGWIDKSTLKRFAIAAPVAAAGAGLGHGVGQLIKRHALSDSTRAALQAAAQKRPWLAMAGKALPAAAGGLAAGAGILQAMKRKKMKDYLEGKDEGAGPQ